MEIRFQTVAYPLILVAGLVTLAGCDAGGSTVPSGLAPADYTNSPTPGPTARPTPAPTPSPTPTPTPTPVSGGSGGTIIVTGGFCGTGTAPRCVSWIAPTVRIDGSIVSIADVSGYIIRYGSSVSDMTNKIVLTDRSVTEYTFSQLTSGTYYIAVSAYDASNVESPTSAVLVRSF